MIILEKRRSKLEITLVILKAIDGGISKPTKIMYAANLSWQPMKKKLTSLVSQKLVNEIVAKRKDKRSRKQYEITEKGKNVLKYFEGMEGIVKV